MNTTYKRVYVVLDKDNKFIDMCDTFKSALGRGIVYITDNVFNILTDTEASEYIRSIEEDFDDLQTLYNAKEQDLAPKGRYTTPNGMITIFCKIV
jgi:hypothetical protein